MSTKLEVPICSVNTTQIRHLSTSAEHLHGIWSVFSKCASSLEDGKRLENLSWRIWNRETFCCDSLAPTTTPSSLATRSRPQKADVPDLSVSVDSFASDDSEESDISDQPPAHSRTAPLDIRRPQSQTIEPTLATSRGKEKHMTPLRLERMIESIKEKQDIAPLSPAIIDALPEIMPSTDITPRPESRTVHAALRSSESSSSTIPISSPESDRSVTETVNSDTSAELIQSHSIVRGFSPNQTSSSYRSHTHLAPAPARCIPHTKQDAPKKGMFMLGGSSGEDDSSFEEHIPPQLKQSSLTAGLKRPVGVGKKKLSFKDEVESRKLNNKSHEDEEVFTNTDEESSEEEDESEDEVEDDDEGDWIDEGAEGGDDHDRPMFQRVDSSANLVSRRSLLTSMMHQGDRADVFAKMAQSQPTLRKCKTQAQIDPSIRFTAQEDDGSTSNGSTKHLKPISMTTSNTHAVPIALSPRTTRRNMLATEMTESLRKAVLYERQQKKATANAKMKRRHTTQDLTSIRAYPTTEADDHETNTGYNATGW